MNRTLTVLVLTLCVSACAIQPGRPPASPLPYAANWQVPPGFKLAEPGDQPLPQAWWAAYRDPVLDALQAALSSHNQTLAQADAQYRLAQGVLASSQASLFPTLNANLNATRSQQPVLTSGGTLASPPASNLYVLSGQASWEPDLWGALHANVASSEASARASLANRGAVLLSLQAQLATSYFQLRTVDANRALLQETVEAYQRSLALTEARLAAGLVARTDVTQARSQLESARASLADARINRDTLQHAIAVLTGQAAQDLAIAERPWQVPQWPAVPLALPSTLLERRPDVANAERLMAAQAARLQATEAAFFPVVSLTTQLGFESKQIRNWISLPKSFWSIGPQLTQTLLDGGNHTALRDEALATLDQTTANYREVVLEAFQSVEDALTTIAALEEEARRQQAAAAAASETLTLVSRQYQAGTVAYLNVLSAQTTLLSAQLNLLGIQGRQAVAHVSLVRALGGGWTASPQIGG